MDLGAKNNVVGSLINRNCEVYVFPASTKADEILKVDPHGIVISNGPGQS